MARQKNRRASFEPFESRSANSRYLRITSDMMRSKAWGELDPFDVTVYVYLKEQYKSYRDGSDNSREIELTYEGMSKIMSPGRFKKSIDNLVEKGFIDLVEHNPHRKRATVYGFSDRWHDYGTEHFKHKARAVLKRPGMTEIWEQKRDTKNKTL